MFDWLFENTKDTKIWVQLVIEAVKIFGGLGTVLLVTRWTLARADNKDSLARQAGVLQAYQADRVNALRECLHALSRIHILLMDLTLITSKGVAPVEEEIDGKEGSKAFILLKRIESEVDSMIVNAIAFGDLPRVMIEDDPHYLADEVLVWADSLYGDVYERRSITDDDFPLMTTATRELTDAIRTLIDHEVATAVFAVKSPEWTHKAWMMVRERTTALSIVKNRSVLPRAHHKSPDALEE